MLIKSDSKGMGEGEIILGCFRQNLRDYVVLIYMENGYKIDSV